MIITYPVMNDPLDMDHQRPCEPISCEITSLKGTMIRPAYHQISL